MEQESRTARPRLRRLLDGTVKLDDIVHMMAEELTELARWLPRRADQRDRGHGHSYRRGRSRDRSRARGRRSRRRERQQPQQQQQQQEPQQQQQQQQPQQHQTDSDHEVDYAKPGGPFGIPEVKRAPRPGVARGSMPDADMDASSASSTARPGPAAASNPVAKAMPAKMHKWPKGWPAHARVLQEVHSSGTSGDMD